MKYNPGKAYFSFPFFRRFMKEWYNYECYLHDCAYIKGGTEIKRWVEDFKFSKRIINKKVPLLARIGGSVIAIIAFPILISSGWWKFHKFNKV